MKSLLLAAASLVSCAAQTPVYRVESVAGVANNTAVPANARDALLNVPYGITADRAGNIYFHDRNDYVIRRLSVDGIVTRFAGSGKIGSSGDGGPALEATINYDIGSMAVGRDGALYFADGWNCTVRRVTTSGVIEGVAGMPNQCGYSGDGGPATSARLNVLGTVAFDAAGDLYIGDFMNNRIRRVRGDGRIETFAGTGVAGFSGDGGPASEARLNMAGAKPDALGNVWIMDAGNYRIRRVDPSGIITTVAGNGQPGPTPDNGPALTSSIGFISYGIAHPNGTFYFDDRPRFALFALTPDGTIRRVAGSGRYGYSGDGGPAELASVTTADDLTALPDGSIAFSDSGNHVIRRLTTAGTIETIAGRRRFDGNYGLAWEQVLNWTTAVAWDPQGGYYLYEAFGGRIRRVDPDGTMITVAGTGEPGVAGDGGLARHAQVGFMGLGGTAALAVDRLRRVYLVVSSNPRVRRFTPGGYIEKIAGTDVPGFSGDGGPATDASLNGPSGIAIAPDGRVFIADTNNHRIRVIDAGGVIRTFAGTGAAGFSGDSGPAASARLSFPGELAMDRAGNLFFLDVGNNRIRRIAADGVITTVAGSGVAGPAVDGLAHDVPLANLRTLAVLPNGSLLFAETTTFFPATRLRHLGADGRVVSLNRATPGYQGDGGPLAEASFSMIHQISVSDYGDVLVADRQNNVIRWLSPERR